MRDLIVILIGIVIFLAVFYGPIILYIKFGWFKKFYHDILMWHKPGKAAKPPYRCKYCGDRIEQDSQGNWFSVELFVK